MWLDESDLEWPKKDRNLYTAHEIAQIVPLVNKNKTYEKLLFQNKWILNFWPNATKVYSTEYVEHSKSNPICRFINNLAYWIQKQHMQSKITSEIVTKNKAIFHPMDWSSKIKLALQKKAELSVVSP
jgi:hypothetical protein